MKRHPAADQVIFASNELGLNPEQIAIQFDMDLSEVRNIIAAEEGVKKLLEKGVDSPEEIEEILKSLALTSQNDKVRFEALKFLHSEKKGRNDIAREELEIKKKKLALEAVNVGMNLSKFNDSIRKARERIGSNSLPPLIAQTRAED